LRQNEKCGKGAREEATYKQPHEEIREERENKNEREGISTVVTLMNIKT
jgi:hypothetical protein